MSKILRRCYSASIWLIVSLLCCVSIFIFMSDYMLFKTQNRISFVFPRDIQMPSVVICSQANWSSLDVRDFLQPNIRHVVRRAMLTALDGDKMTRMDLIRKDCASMTTITPFVQDGRSCIVVSFLGLAIDGLMVRSTLTSLLLDMNYRNWNSKQEFTQVYLLPGDRKTFLDSSSDCVSYTPTDRTRLMVYLLTYSRTTTRLLRPPFDTRCKDYSAVGLDSQAHCVDACIKRATQEKCLSLPSFAHIFVSETRNFSLTSQARASTTQALDQHFLRQCQHECRQEDCYSSRLMPVLLRHREHHLRPGDTERTTREGRLMLVPPSEPDIVIETTVATSLAVLIVNIVNSISLWTGVCPMEESGRVSRLLRRSMRRQQAICQAQRRQAARLVKVLLLTLCLSLGTWQLTELATTYFAYPTVSKVSVHENDTQLVPAFGVCSPVPSMNAGAEAKTVVEFFDWLSQPSERIELLRHFEHLTMECHISKSCTMNATRFMRSGKVCLLVQASEAVFDASDPRRQRLFSIRYPTGHYKNTSWLREVSVFLSSSDVGAFTGIRSFIQDFFPMPSWLQASFTLFHQQRLPPPYDTACRSAWLPFP